VLALRRSADGRALSLAQERFLQRPGRARAGGAWPIPWVARLGGGRTQRRLVTRARERVALGRGKPAFVYGNAEESGFFRPLHAPPELRALLASLGRLLPVERMGLVDHQWALARAGRAELGSWLDLAFALGAERSPDVLEALVRPLVFLVDGLVDEAAPACDLPFRRALARRFAPALRELGLERRRGEAEEERLRRAALLALAGGVAGDELLLREAAKRCERYLADRRSLDANLADPIVSLAARVGDAELQRRFVQAMSAAATPQEQRRFLLALGAFREPELVERSLALALSPRVAKQDVAFLLGRLLANPAARDATWRFIRERWSALEQRLPPLLAGRLVEATAWLLRPGQRSEVARHFRAHRIPSAARALRQVLERLDWYRGFRRRAAGELRAWLTSRS
jgi:aminopeptidase N